MLEILEFLVSSHVKVMLGILKSTRKHETLLLPEVAGIAVVQTIRLQVILLLHFAISVGMLHPRKFALTGLRTGHEVTEHLYSRWMEHVIVHVVSGVSVARLRPSGNWLLGTNGLLHWEALPQLVEQRSFRFVIFNLSYILLKDAQLLPLLLLPVR